MVTSISSSKNNSLDETQVYHKKNLKHKSGLGLHYNYRYEQSKAVGRQDWDQPGRGEALSATGE